MKSAGGVQKSGWRGEENVVEWRERHEGYLWMARLKLTEVGELHGYCKARSKKKRVDGRVCGWVGGWVQVTWPS